MSKNGSENKHTILVSDLVKNFVSVDRGKGLFGKVRSLINPKKKTVEALKKINFSIDEGELVGFIGPNGAGKTTTLKILSGLLYPTAGFVNVAGYNPWDRKANFLKKIAIVMGQKNQLWWDLPAIDTLELNCAIYEIPKTTYKETLRQLTELLEVEDLLNTQVRKLSLGQRMRFELIAALIHKPQILFLDEPTIGLDVVAQQKVRDFIRDYNKKFGSTVMLTSHNMDDVVDLAKRVIVIDKGEILFDGKLTELVSNFAKEKTIKLYFSSSVDAKSLESIARVKKYEFPQATIVVPRESAAFAAAEVLQNFPVADLTIEEENIESIIRKVFRGGVTNS